LKKEAIMSDGYSRRNFLTCLLAATGAGILSGCRRLSESGWFVRMLGAGETATRKVQRLIVPRKALAQEFPESDLSPRFRSNGSSMPGDPAYIAQANSGFRTYRLKVGGLVERPMSFSLEDIRSLPSRTQITRHDCVEGWSAIGKWKGARLSALLETVRPKPEARYVLFYCADLIRGASYYESIDMEDAFHPQTLLAYELNDGPLPIANGAPLRLRVERQLGYKMAKYVMGLELVEDFSSIRGGKGGYWEDRGYEWYAGI
jgi:DMSO/TMAO reductase YedYZ molybdopterin-dependent catalytic subunit